MTRLLATVLEFDPLERTELERAKRTDEAEKDPGVAGVEARVGLCPALERKDECWVFSGRNGVEDTDVISGSGVEDTDVISDDGATEVERR